MVKDVEHAHDARAIGAKGLTSRQPSPCKGFGAMIDLFAIAVSHGLLLLAVLRLLPRDALDVSPLPPAAPPRSASAVPALGLGRPPTDA